MLDPTKSLSNGAQDILDVCRDIRLMCAELHHYYADLFVDVRSALLLWKRTALGEKNQAKELAVIANHRCQKVIHSFRRELLDAEIALIYLRSLIERTKHNPPSLVEALKTSIKLEEKLTRFNIQNIMEFTGNSLSKQFTKVIQVEQERIASFRNAYKQLVAPQLDNSFQCDLAF
jgi:hypothetical protein